MRSEFQQRLEDGLQRRIALAMLFAVFACDPISAQDAKVRASVSSEDPIWVGQQVTLVVELLAPGYFASVVNFDLPDPQGVLLMPPADHPVVGNEDSDGVTYTVQRYEVRAWPMRAGAQTIPALTARFSFKRNPLDTDVIVASLTTSPVAFTVALPPGAERLGTVISARGLEIEENWKPEPGAAAVRAGAAFTRTVTISAPGVPGMLLPPLPVGDIDGLGIYAKPQLLDSDERGTLTGIRRDVVTYVCKATGEFTIPAVQFAWFALDTMQLRTEQLPARTLNVIANPAMASASASSRPWTRFWLAGIAALLMVFKSAGARRLLVRLVAPFRPVHLQPLNPP